MLNVNFEAMEEKYLEILRHYINPNDCKTVIQMLLNLHSVSNCTECNTEINYKGICEMCYTEQKLNDLD